MIRWPQGLIHLVARCLAPRPSLAPCPGWHLSAGVSYRLRRYRWRRALLRRTTRPFNYRWHDGLTVRIDPRFEMTRFLYLTGRYEPNEMHWLDGFLQPGMSVIDVGANVGFHTMFAAAKVGPAGRVLALEPSRREVALLREHVALNRLDHVTVIEAAAHERQGQAMLRVAADNNAGHNTLGAFCYDHTQLDHRQPARLCTLDDLVTRHGMDRVDLIKLDVEGAELFALRGAAQTLERYRPALLVEVNDPALRHQGCTAAQLRHWLAGRGYALHGLCPNTGGLLAKPDDLDTPPGDSLIAVRTAA